jgi:uncharacterized delta-60 repeat protein
LDQNFMTAGDIDPQFGAVSLANTFLPKIGLVQPDGKILVADQTALARYNIDGSIDSSFGTNGQILLSSLTFSPINTVTALAIQPNGSIIIATGQDRAQLVAPSFLQQSALFRLNVDGSIDQAFNQNAKYSSSVTGAGSNLLSVQPDGSIVSLGSNNIYRYEPNGTLQFIANLEAATSVGNIAGLHSFATQQANKIVTADYIASAAIFDLSGNNYSLVLNRYNLDGTLDRTFGNNGTVIGTELPDFRVTGVTTDANGQLILTGANELLSPGTGTTLLVKYSSNGVLDQSFGTNGVVNTGLIDWRFTSGQSSLKVQPDNKILISGRDNVAVPGGFANSEPFLLRYNSNGVLDSSFGDGGSLRIDSSAGILAVQANNDILSIGATITGQAKLSRYLSAGDLPIDRLAAGSESNDHLAGGRGNDFFRSGGGNDTVWGGYGNDTIDGENGNDTILGEAGADRLYGANGDDLLLGGQGGDYLHSGYGDDTLLGGEDGDLLIGDAGNDLLVGDDAVSAGSDILYGGDGADTLQGAGGNDILDGESGNDSLVGGLGDDFLYGADDDDQLDGGEGNDSINGGYGNDWLVGAAGDDTLFGDDGLDTLIGGFGRDLFVAYVPTSGQTAQADKIADFEVGVDKISLSKAAFGALQSLKGAGFSATTDFAVVTGIEAVGQSSAVIVYNTADNSLTYKPFGTKAIFAKLDGVVTVSANDFQITD